MSVREYVGARYVPIVAGEWDGTRTYEPLVIVTYQGNSYTSRQYVPAGIEIANEGFWALTGNYNAQVEHYREEVKTCNGRITAAQETADKAKTAAEAATTAASNATTAIAEEKKRAETEETKIQSLAETNKTGITHLDAQMAATAESELLTRISNEVANRTEADTSIETSLAAEVANRTEADTSIETSLTALINAKFPIQTSDLDDGAVTAPKIADSAVNAILQGLTIRSFDSSDSNADNDGLLCPSDCRLSGFYVSELQILVVTAFQIYKTTVYNASHNVRLPNYVQRPAAIHQLSDMGLIVWDSGSNFKTWSGVRIDPEGYIYPNSTVDAADSANMPATITAYLRPYASGESVTPSNAYDAFKSQSGVI